MASAAAVSFCLLLLGLSPVVVPFMAPTRACPFLWPLRGTPAFTGVTGVFEGGLLPPGAAWPSSPQFSLCSLRASPARARTCAFGLIVIPGGALPFVDGRGGPILSLKLPLCAPVLDSEQPRLTPSWVIKAWDLPGREVRWMRNAPLREKYLIINS